MQRQEQRQNRGFFAALKNDSRDLQRQRQRQRQQQMRGFFAALRMTAELATTTAKAEAKTKAERQRQKQRQKQKQILRLWRRMTTKQQQQRQRQQQRRKQRRLGWLSVCHPTHREVRDEWGTRLPVLFWGGIWGEMNNVGARWGLGRRVVGVGGGLGGVEEG
jgi:hypothetical protein